MSFFRGFIFFLIATEFLLVLADEVSLTVIVPAGKTECYMQTIADEKYFSFEIDYQVVGGGDNDISFSIFSPKRFQIVQDSKRTYSSHRVELDDESNGRGDYKFCFDNSFSTNSDKRVFFGFYLMDRSGQYLGQFGALMNSTESIDIHIENFEKVTTSVKNKLNVIERIQRYYASAELSDRSVLERSYEMVNFWSIVHLFVMLFAAGVQVFMLRSLFEDQSRIGRILRKGKLND